MSDISRAPAVGPSAPPTNVGPRTPEMGPRCSKNVANSSVKNSTAPGSLIAVPRSPGPGSTPGDGNGTTGSLGPSSGGTDNSFVTGDVH